MKITTLNRTTLSELRNILQSDLDALGAKHGLKFTPGSASYSRDGDLATFKLEVATVGSDGVPVDKDKKAFMQNCGLFGLTSADFGSTFTRGGDEFQICGLNTRGRKYPILAKNLTNGKRYKFNNQDVRALLGKTL